MSLQKGRNGLDQQRRRVWQKRPYEVTMDAGRMTGRILFPWVLVLGPIAVTVSGGSVFAASGVVELVSQVKTDSYRDFLRNDLYAHNGDDRSCLGPQHDLARQRIRERFEGFGLATSLGPPFPACGRLNYNVVAVHPGRICPEEIYIVGAHYDSADGSPGAWDNASGVAGVLEAARILSQYAFEATIVFIAFDREEEGRKGSDAYVQEHRLDHIRGMIALDGIAYRPYQPNDADYGKVGLYYQTKPAKLVDDLAAAMRSYAGLTCVIARDDLTDDAPFDRLGFAAVALISRGLKADVPPFMHKPSDSVDTPGYLDYDYGTQVTQGVVGYLAAQARRTIVRVLPDFNADGLVNLRDFALLAQHWGGHKSEFDIAPAPKGDGIVDFDDLAGLGYYWLNRWSNWWPDFALSSRSPLGDESLALLFADRSDGGPAGESVGEQGAR